MDNQLKKWIKWLKVVHDDIQQLLVKRNIFWEVQEIIKSNNALHKPSSFYDYLGDTYVAYVSIGIRRQIKVNSQSISFARLLTEIIDTPSVLSRKYYTGLYEGSVVEDLADRDFDKFSGSGQSCISKSMVETDLNRLNQVSSKVEDFADKRIAHHDKRIPKVLPKFNEVDACLDVLDELYVKYHLVFHADAMDSLMPTYQYDWKVIFEVPWLKPEEDLNELV
jgi:hypothetical protein